MGSRRRRRRRRRRTLKSRLRAPFRTEGSSHRGVTVDGRRHAGATAMTEFPPRDWAAGRSRRSTPTNTARSVLTTGKVLRVLLLRRFGRAYSNRASARTRPAPSTSVKVPSHKDRNRGRESGRFGRQNGLACGSAHGLFSTTSGVTESRPPGPPSVTTGGPGGRDLYLIAANALPVSLENRPEVISGYPVCHLPADHNPVNAGSTVMHPAEDARVDYLLD